ncbi:hypothetical protein LD11_gp252 [Bacillus phage Riley]|uniref:Uncharacterized protein n=1 Tax=Bacillus phage Riley TaxID=1486662 RepID=A0A075LYY9_9CAUD|nr:hypothetical protein LD11_gp252 [Bacillus phage Riley]AIF72128.1 hypothetical protein [Bacillus phage Riley]ULF48877.1 hypothetical protein [Bacillus phage BillyBob]
MKYKVGFEFEIKVVVAYEEFGFDLHTGTTASIVDTSYSTKKPYIIEDEYNNFIMPVSEEELESLVARPIFPTRKDKLAQWIIILTKSNYGGEDHDVIKCMSKQEVKEAIEDRKDYYDADDILVFPPLSNMIADELYKEEE